MRCASFEVIPAVIMARTGGRGVDNHRECETVQWIPNAALLQIADTSP